MQPLTFHASSVTKSNYPAPSYYRTDVSTLSKIGGTINRGKDVKITNTTPGPGRYFPLNRAKSVPGFVFNDRGKTDVDIMISNKTYHNNNDEMVLPPTDGYLKKDIVGCGKFNQGKRANLFSKHAKDFPAPHAYQNYVFDNRQMSHGVISEARTKSELDWALRRAMKIPGPGHYGDLKPFGTDIPGNGKINDAKPKNYLEQAVYDNKDVPGPAAYNINDNPTNRMKGGKLSSAMPKSDVEWKIYFASKTPAPHDYNIPFNAGKNFKGGKFSLEKRQQNRWKRDAAQEPGPSDYQNVGFKNDSSSAIIVTSNAPSHLEIAMARASQTPAPGDYLNTNNSFGNDIEGGQISKAKVPSVLARQIRLASEIPGVGEYDVSKCEGNRLKGFDFGKVEDRWPDKNRFHHYQPTPGPGEYIKLHQSSSMGYQRESRYPTSSSSIVLRKHEILDSRSKYNTGPGKYEYVDSFGIQFESSKKTNPIVAFGKGEGHQHREPPEDMVIPHATKYDSMKALDKLLKQTVVTGEKANYKARLRKARINRWKWRRKHNF